MIHDVRIIPLDAPAHLPPDIHQWLGDSRGHWDGETLVVETTNFTDRIGSFSTTGLSWGTGASLHLTERFTRIDADTLLYEFTVDNPLVFTNTFSATFPMHWSDLPLYEYACHEGNYGLANILSGARAEERVEAAAEEESKGSSQRSVQFWSVSMANKSSIVSDLHGWRTPSVSGEELQAPGKSGPQ